MKELFKNLLEKYSTSFLPFIYGGIVVMLVFFSLSYFNVLYKRMTLTETVEMRTVKTVSTEKSKNFIKCIYEQLECYHANVGIDKATVIEACKDISYCDDAKEK